MAAETRVEKQNKINQLIAAGTGIGAGIAQYKIDKHFSKLPLNRLQRITRAGVIGSGLAGLGLLVNRRFYNRAKQHERDLIEEKGKIKKMANNEYFDNTGLQEFVKIAAATMGSEAYTVPTKYAYNAYLLYNELPDENREAITIGLYNAVQPGMDKVAMKLVAANVYAEENHEKIAGALSAAGSLATPIMGAVIAKNDATEKLDRANAKSQHKIPNPGFH